ncbi:hypothetical protein [Pseudoroseicyclus sp. CXY001]|uniref:hypothetical protein n=1 Tax=Pseudoroseicyclus sp. CXY001 TaxID=3242492 RepID=UPI0035716359
MSADKTDLDKQSRRHRGPIIGISIAVIIGIILAIFMTVTAVNRGTQPEGADTQIDATGDAVLADDGVTAEEPVTDQD